MHSHCKNVYSDFEVNDFMCSRCHFENVPMHSKIGGWGGGARRRREGR